MCTFKVRMSVIYEGNRLWMHWESIPYHLGMLCDGPTRFYTSIITILNFQEPLTGPVAKFGQLVLLGTDRGNGRG